MPLNASSEDWVPVACTLPTEEQPVRVAEFDRLFATSVVRVDRRDETSLELLLTEGSEHLGRELAAKETDCCSFFVFTFTASREGVVMGIEVPSTKVEVLDALEARIRTAQSKDRP